MPDTSATRSGARPPSNPEADSLLVICNRAMDGDENAFEELHRRLRGGIERLFLQRTGGQVEVAEELGQRTWIEVWRSLSARRYDAQRAAVSTFVYAIGLKVWLQHRRKLRTGPKLVDEFDDLLSSLMQDDEEVGGELYVGQLLEAMRRCMWASGPNALTPEERDIVSATAEGDTERTLAARLGIAASTVNVRKKTAYAKLRRALALEGHTFD